MVAFFYTNNHTQVFEQVIAQERAPHKTEELLVGIDSGAASLLLAILDSKGKPLAGALRIEKG